MGCRHEGRHGVSKGRAGVRECVCVGVCERARMFERELSDDAVAEFAPSWGLHERGMGGRRTRLLVGHGWIARGLALELANGGRCTRVPCACVRVLCCCVYARARARARVRARVQCLGRTKKLWTNKKYRVAGGFSKLGKCVEFDRRSMIRTEIPESGKPEHDLG